jgi:IS30 family transposase
MAKHKDFTVATDVQVYFCDLLLRQYFPRGTDLSVHYRRQYKLQGAFQCCTARKHEIRFASS